MMSQVDRIKVEPLTNQQLEDLELGWHTDCDGSCYISDELVLVTQEEAEAYYNAVNDIYEMYVEAGEYVIENNLFHDIGIPFNLVDTIKMSWENDVHWHLYGRFDLAGGIAGKPIKLIEFNADTPTALYETAVIQWAILKANGLEEQMQFNNVFEAIKENFKRLITLSEDTSGFDDYYEGWKILFSSIAGDSEEETTTRFLQQAAMEAGFNTSFEYLDKVGFIEEEGIFDSEKEYYEYWFKLFPWEDIAIDESELALILKEILENQKSIILNPAYTLMFQSKGMLKILYDLFPDSPYLLETSFEPLKDKAYVEKRVFGREGDNTAIYNTNGDIIEQRDGVYGNYKPIYQEYTELPTDENNQSYQAGVFFAYEGCGLGFRRGNKILDNMSKFVGHIIK
jgi:glutathionylspermidine synthase